VPRRRARPHHAKSATNAVRRGCAEEGYHCGLQEDASRSFKNIGACRVLLVTGVRVASAEERRRPQNAGEEAVCATHSIRSKSPSADQTGVLPMASRL